MFQHDGVGVCIHLYELFYETQTFLKGESLSAQVELVRVQPETVGQFTGLVDKNGLKIFEGDIVDILCENEETGLIEWDKDTARFIVSSCNFESDFDNYYGTDLEIIGNIYDIQNF